MAARSHLDGLSVISPETGFGNESMSKHFLRAAQLGFLAIGALVADVFLLGCQSNIIW